MGKHVWSCGDHGQWNKPRNFVCTGLLGSGMFEVVDMFILINVLMINILENNSIDLY